MRVPLSWLRDWVDVPADATPEDVHAALVKVGLEEEEVHRFEISGPVVVGRVLDFEAEPQSNGKTIRWCQVDVGEFEPRGIVCGAANFEVGDEVVVALPGAVLPGPFEISARKTYGHVSDGMMASARELSLGDDHAGILVLRRLGIDAEPGEDAVALLGLDDTAVEVNVTPDRGYAFSIRGVAREYSHATGAAFRDPAAAVEPVDGRGFAFRVDDARPIRGRNGCEVFVTRTVRGIDPTRPTPAAMVSRLRLAGIRSISLPVDITNYVMLELGQPIHGYDLAKLSGGITVRRAEPGETLETLDEAVRTLHPEDLLITDDSGPIGLAGVMGGARTEISDATTDVLVEAAVFDPVSIARTARRHKLPSEASKRYERGVDPRIAAAAAARVVQLLVDLAGGTADALGSVYDVASAPDPIALPQGFVAGLVGADFNDAEVREALAVVGARVDAAGSDVLVTPPSWRPDIVGAAELAEEAARILGYDRIPSRLPVAPPGRGLTRAQSLRRAAADALAAAGAVEVLAYPFVTREQNDAFGTPDAGEPVPAVKVANALDAHVPYLRTSLLPGLIQVAHRNLSRGLTDLAFFEQGLVFRPEPGVEYGTRELPRGGARPDGEQLAALDAGIPPQPRHVAGLFLGSAVDKQPGQPAVVAGLADALAAVQQLAAAVHVTVTARQTSHQSLHPGRAARLVARGPDGERELGYAGELLPALAEDNDLPRVVGVFELDLDALIGLAPELVAPSPLSAYPAATQDLSLVVAAGSPAGEVLAAVREGAGELLEDIRLVDDYRGTGIPDGRKSLTFALRFRAADRTLTAAEASDAKLAGAAFAADRFGATIRD